MLKILPKPPDCINLPHITRRDNRKHKREKERNKNKINKHNIKYNKETTIKYNTYNNTLIYYLHYLNNRSSSCV